MENNKYKTRLQEALDWWNSLPVQDIEGDMGWANLTMVYHPNRGSCYAYTDDEIYEMWCKVHGLNKIDKPLGELYYMNFEYGILPKYDRFKIKELTDTWKPILYSFGFNNNLEQLSIFCHFAAITESAQNPILNEESSILPHALKILKHINLNRVIILPDSKWDLDTYEYSAIIPKESYEYYPRPILDEKFIELLCEDVGKEINNHIDSKYKNTPLTFKVSTLVDSITSIHERTIDGKLIIKCRYKLN